MTLKVLADVIGISMVLSAVYALVSLSWVFVYRATGILNFATAPFILLGAYVFYWLTIDAGLSFVPSLLGALFIVAVLGALVYLVLLRPLAGQPMFSQIAVTMGLTIVMMSFIAITWSGKTHTLPDPIRSQIYELPGSIRITTFGLCAMAAALATVLGTMAALKFSRIGIQMRATAEHPLLASQRGIRISVIFALAFAVAAATAALAGISTAHVLVLSPALAALGLRGLAPALIGGFDSVGGTIVGAIIVAFIETIAVTAFGGGVRDAAVFVTLLLALAIRPYGIFGRPEIRRV